MNPVEPEPASLKHREPLREPRPPVILGRKHAAGAAVAAAVVDAALVLRAGADIGATIFSVVFMGVFTYVGFRFITKIRYGVRPPQAPPSTRDAGDRPAPGGWANPTNAQARLARLLKLFRK